MPSYQFSKLAFLAAFLVYSQLAAAFTVTHSSDKKWSKTALAVSFSSHAGDDFPEGSHPNRRVEFSGLEPLPESSTRQARVSQDKKNRRKFVKFGEDLWSLRKVMNSLSLKLVAAINSGVREKEEEIREQLREAEQQDPDLVYRLELEKLLKAKSEGRTSDATRHSKKAIAARSCLPQYNLDGLWVGK
jgi:hypothetical protein